MLRRARHTEQRLLELQCVLHVVHGVDIEEHERLFGDELRDP
jgi:hypothetical protein